MRVGVMGINYKSSSLELREILARTFQKVFGRSQVNNHVLLSTCNRTELYFGEPLADRHIQILGKLKEEIDVSFEHALYSYFGKDCFNHLGRVISGVDSAIFGESDIQRQVKRSYEKVRVRSTLSSEIHYLFQKGLKIGKEIRSSFLMSNKELPLPQAIQSIIHWHGYPLEAAKILLVGNSSINRKLLSFFQHLGKKGITLATRMKTEIPQDVVCSDWEALKKWDQFDVVICGTIHEGYVLPKLERVSKKTLLFDLSIPRNIPPEFQKNPQLKLYNIDQIGEVAAERKSEKEIALCETLIEKAVARQMKLFVQRREAKWRYATAL
ncbi:MAG: hypothetical protein KDK60_00280 [Chlamydiia bacterium]|nr:hypothetical protein [Chlamydiia bacterium]